LKEKCPNCIVCAKENFFHSFNFHWEGLIHIRFYIYYEQILLLEFELFILVILRIYTRRLNE
jgi:hypothetical protein